MKINSYLCGIVLTIKDYSRVKKKRTKSINDLREQYRRILSNPRLTPQREARAWYAADDYEQNIRNLARNREENRRITKAILNTAANRGWDNREIERITADYNNRQYSRRQYMGLSNG